ncbi:hemerythrin domain-containing protein [Parasedimentitalea marina]|uniref:Hemerythrin domain-containing protein n=1 Tax=Parasedimentitalea marina TaxID=2483033 RepID=A0A3T0N3T5_9RHOB|nr:hemerythrin domain-containing protein [Parasedimentitalea marina]AZV78700.1 hemerythrin domain-containing protein [Parasedimentitalea marina]
MLDTYTIRQDEMPDEMRFLLKQYPRDSWDAHPGFREKTKHWLGAHQMFRRVAERIRLDTEGLLNKDIGLGDFARRLSHYGGNLVGNLHGHHGWEDHSYFPELSGADPRFDAGLEVLEQDHADLDKVLDDFTRTANRLIKLTTLDRAQAYEEAARVLKTSAAIEGFLKRHLSDEEELAVPIILHHRLRG